MAAPFAVATGHRPTRGRGGSSFSVAFSLAVLLGSFETEYFPQ